MDDDTPGGDLNGALGCFNSLLLTLPFWAIAAVIAYVLAR
jgi:hypothetical protein